MSIVVSILCFLNVRGVIICFGRIFGQWLVLYAMGSWSGSCYSMFACIVMWCRFSLMTLSAFLSYGSGSLAIVVFG